MKSRFPTFLFGFNLILVMSGAITPTPVFAASKSNQIKISYGPSKKPAHQKISNQLKSLRFLENLQANLSPFRLPRSLLFSLEACNGDPSVFYEKTQITICYESVEALQTVNLPKSIGPLLSITLHEFAHALFDYLDPPLLGGEEQAADRVAAYIFLQLGKQSTPKLIFDTANTIKTLSKSDDEEEGDEYGKEQEHSSPQQRISKLLCLSFGSDPKLYNELVTKDYLETDDKESCQDEYQQLEDAFAALIEKHIDVSVAQKISSNGWVGK